MATVTAPKRQRATPAPAYLRRRLEEAAERIIAALDALDAPEADLEDGHDAEAFADDAEPSLGATSALNQDKAWRDTFNEPDLEFEGDTVAECDREDGCDREDDPAELGIADDEGYREHLTGEPSLGATLDVDQGVAWGADRLSGLFDGEATGTEDDTERFTKYADRVANQRADASAIDQAREIVRPKRGNRVMGLPFPASVNR